jgi:cytochrome c-type biogenesis protein CcmH/NrfG
MANKKTKRTKIGAKKTINVTPWLYGIIIACLAFLLYSNTLSHGYALDDYSVLKDNFITQNGVESIPEIFKTHFRAGYKNWGTTVGELYRPVTLSIFALQWEISPDNASVYHFINVLLYALSGCLIFFTLARILSGYNLLIPFFTTLLFVAHPVHVEAVANIKSLDEILALLFCFGALNLMWKYWERNDVKLLIASILCYTLAMFSKENSITFLAVFPLTYWFFGKKFSVQKMATSAVFLIPIICYLFVRKLVLGTVTSAKDTAILDNVIAHANSFGEQLATAFLFLGKYLLTMVFPHPLGSDFGYPQIPLTGFGDWRVLLALLVILGLVIYAIKSMLTNKNIVAYGILFFFINFSIFTNILIFIGTNYGDRLLYSASLGFTLALTVLVLTLTKTDLKIGEKRPLHLIKSAVPAVAILSIIFVLYSFKTITRNPVWENSYTLYKSDVKIAPNSAKLNYHYGLEVSKTADDRQNASEKQQLYAEGMTHLQKAVKLYPQYRDAYGRMGITHYRLKNYEESLKNYNQAIQYKPVTALIYSNMGTLYFEMKNIEKAKASYQKAVEVDPRFTDGWRNLGSLNAQTGNFPAAIQAFQEALKYVPNDATINFYLGSSYLDSGNEAAGRPYLNRAYQLNPNFPKK